jgi:TfoX/Sxy family transcriptional regulator of competence genes
MPSMPKSPPELVARFDSVAVDFPRADRRLTFGYPSLTVGGNMVTGLHGDGWFVRLGPAETDDALALDGAAPFMPMPGRPMTGYTVLPADVAADDDAIRAWVERAVEFGATLPPKTPKAKGKATAG